MGLMKQNYTNFTRQTVKLLTVAASIVLALVPTAASASSMRHTSDESRAFDAAAKEFHVPKSVLMATSYNLTRWETHAGQMSADGGYGPMDLRTSQPAEDGRGDPARPIPANATSQHGDDTLSRAAQLLGTSTTDVQNDVTQNIRGGAAVLADKAKQLGGGKLPQKTSDWYKAVAAFSGSDATNADAFADDVFSTAKSGAADTTSDGQAMSVPADSGATTKNAPQKNTNGVECPSDLNCRFVPAGYAANSSDPTDYGNYDNANRPQDMQIKYIVIHDTEGSYDSAIAHFQDTSSYVSAHYVIRSSDGAVTQMVPTKDVAWHAGDWYMNMHSIGIEHEGVAAAGSTWYTEAMYKSSAELVRYLAKKYNIPLDRQHILGHDNIPGLTDASLVANHWDPGPYWDWNHYMDLVQGKQAGTNAREQASQAKNNNKNSSTGNVVTISPTMSANKQTVQSCDDANVCSDLTAPSNFVYLRTASNANAPLLADKELHPDGSHGTTKIDDWSAKATTGQKYVLAGRDGDWTAIWFGNQRGWFYNPASAPTASFSRSQGQVFKLKSSVAQAKIYGAAYPEASAYPAGVHSPLQTQPAYTIYGGQQYVSDGIVPTDYFYDYTVNSSAPYDHQVFTGQDKFIKFQYNQRVMFIRASDVVMQ
jgi:N-acetyl-anhydromuramyl-L-alanine amidase AmpD